MESFTIELVSNASAQLFPENTLSCFTKFLPEQLNLEGQWEVAISEIYYQSVYQNVTDRKVMFFHKKLSKSSEFYCLEPGLYPSIADIVETMNILIRERHTAKIASQFKCPEERKKLRFTLPMKDVVLHSLVGIWDTFCEVMLVMNLK